MTDDCDTTEAVERARAVFGSLIWHTSEEGGGPDVGIEITLHGGARLWVGEISRNRWEELSDDSKDALGNDFGFWMILYGPGHEHWIIGKCVDQYEAWEAIERLVGFIKLPAPKDTP